jgi:hypothetical protein
MNPRPSCKVIILPPFYVMQALLLGGGASSSCAVFCTNTPRSASCLSFLVRGFSPRARSHAHFFFSPRFLSLRNRSTCTSHRPPSQARKVHIQHNNSGSSAQRGDEQSTDEKGVVLNKLREKKTMLLKA